MKTITLLLSLTLLSACAAIIDGSNQEVSIETSGHTAARCEAKNGHGAWNIPSTPGTRMIKGAYSDLDITCFDPVTGATGKKAVESSTNAWVFGNILLGGILGVGYDMGSGAAYVYPEKILVPMSIANTNNANSHPTEPLIVQPQSVVTPAGTLPPTQAYKDHPTWSHQTNQRPRYVPIPYGKKLAPITAN